MVLNKKERYNTLKGIIESKGGMLISKEYINDTIKINVECENGHQWDVRPSSIIRGTWCAICSYLNRKKRDFSTKMIKNKEDYFNYLKEIIEMKGGTLISSYKNDKKRYKFIIKCKNKHQWETEASIIYSGRWCPYCNRTTRDRVFHFNYLKQLIEMKGGKLISTEYIHCQKNVTIECKNGHIWEATPNQIQNGSWCIECRNKLKKGTSRKQVRAIIESKGNTLVRAYRDSNKVKILKIKCKNGHIWEIRRSKIKTNASCPYCSRKNY